MPNPTNAEINDFGTLGRSALDLLSRDFSQPLEVRQAAREARKKIVSKRLREAIGDFRAATAEFAGITRALIAVTEAARRDPVGDGVGMLTPAIRRAGELLTAAGDLLEEPQPKTDGETPPPADPPPPPSGEPAPPIGAAKNSKKFSELADEYIAVWRTAAIDPARASKVERMRERLISHRGEYEGVASATGVPWHVIGVIHALESGFNFGRHLHNGDNLAQRTKRVPAGRPVTPDPPYAWSTSAIDALQHHALQLVGDWTLPRQLFELERYNGFGYRFKGLSTPYLWSFSDRYVSGKYVADGVFDRNAVSKQVGAAVIMKAMVAKGDIAEPPEA